MILFHLPFPPSVNHANKVGRNKRTGAATVYSGNEKQKFFKDADVMYYQQKPSGCVKGPFTYHLILNEGLRHGNADGDNRGKYCLDYLQRVGLIENDKLAHGGSWCWGPCEHGALISVYPHRVPETSNESANERAGT